MSIDTNNLRDALSTFVTGITVITAVDQSNQAIGITINSFSSVSLDPPLVLWSLAKDAKEYERFMQVSHYCINILSDKQQALSEQFANPYHDKFANVNVEQGQNGTPKLTGCASHFECSHWQHYDGGDHTILLGKIEQFDHNDADPLVFHSSKYKSLSKK